MKRAHTGTLLRLIQNIWLKEKEFLITKRSTSWSQIQVMKKKYINKLSKHVMYAILLIILFYFWQNISIV